MNQTTLEKKALHAIDPLDRPIFIVGTGRCGSTILYQLLSNHPQLGWISSWVDAFPMLPWLTVLNRFYQLPGGNRFRQRRFFPLDRVR